jgi:hypothetical protein
MPLAAIAIRPDEKTRETPIFLRVERFKLRINGIGIRKIITSVVIDVILRASPESVACLMHVPMKVRSIGASPGSHLAYVMAEKMRNTMPVAAIRV